MNEIDIDLDDFDLVGNTLTTIAVDKDGNRGIIAVFFP